jgi:BirA family biotin operon repressor/biotin-[acetyl-CoA-carboxylase] ligase
VFRPLDFQLEVVEECGSTNEALLALRGQTDFPGHALLALRQTAGQGRRGREWQSPEGNLALTVAFRTEVSARAPLYSILIGLAAHRALLSVLPQGLDLRLKWPNDIYLGGKKLAGILTQAKQQGSSTDLVVGIGINLAQAPAGFEATAVAEFTTAPSPAAFARVLLNELKALMVEIKDFETLKMLWEKAARLSETTLTILGEAGEWQALELLSSGELAVINASGARRKLASETVSVRLAEKRS